MASLDDYLDKEVSLDSLGEQVQTAPTVSNRPSNINLAAHVAILSGDPEQLETVYRSANSQLDQGISQDVINSLVSKARENNYAKSRQALTEFLTDPRYSDEEKRQASLAVLDAENEQFNIRNSLSLEALESESGDENGEAEFVRVSLSDSVSELNEYKRNAQALLNAEGAKSNTNTLKAFGDIFEYFVPFVESKFAVNVRSALENGDSWSHPEALVLLGSSKSSLKEMVQSVPPEQRMEFSQKIVDIINENSNIIQPDENDFGRTDMIRTLLEDGYYEDEDKWIDNVVSLLDLTIIGGIAGRIGRGGKGLGSLIKTSAQDLSDAARRAVRSRVQPTSVSQNYKDTNPAKARAAHDAAAEDGSGELAEALYGTTKNDAISSDLLPEMATESGSVTAKVSKPDVGQYIRTANQADITDFASRRGALEYFPEEKAAMRAKVVNDFEQVEGMRARKEMFQVESVADGVKVKGVYGPTKSGYSSPERALDMAMWSLRDYGVRAEDLTLLVRQGNEYVPTTLKDLKAERVVSETVKKAGKKPRIKLKSKQPDFLVQVEHQYKFNQTDLEDWTDVDVLNNWFSRTGVFIGKSGQGSLQRSLVDPASSLHPRITLGANVAVDKAAALEKQLLEMGSGFADQFKKLPKERQTVIDQVIREANDKGIDLPYSKLVAEGFSGEEIKALKTWREYWDTVYTLENRDLAKTLASQGFKEFIDPTSDTRIFAKPMARNKVSGSVKVFDQNTDTIRNMSKQEISDLYESGGTLARIKQPISVGDEAAEMIVSTEKPGGSYLRGINESTQVLNYRKGYYSVSYTDPHFVEKIVRNSRGEEMYRKAVASTGSIQDARKYAEGLNAQRAEGEFVEYVTRRDEKGIRHDSDTYWDIQQSKGRTAQKVRGQRLEDATSNLDDPSQANILGPVDSMVHSARSVSNRVSMRETIEVNKGRILSQYADLLPTGKFGQKEWPSNVKDVKYRGVGSEDSKRIADARTSYEYVNYLENGYINSLDEGIKALLRSAADAAGSRGFKSLEKVANTLSDQRGITGAAKGVAFTAYLATNPLRQFIIQSHQAVQLAANYPRWVASQRAIPELITLTSFQLGTKPPKSVLKSMGMSMEDAELMYKQWNESGLAASIDKQNLIRGSLADMTDQVGPGRLSNAPVVGPVISGARNTVSFLRKIGFDAGENVNMMTAWLANRDTARRAGKNLMDQEVADEITGLARNYTYNMNAAGDMPYNQNALAAIFQFMQVPHKALTTMTLNRNLSKSQKLRLAGFNGVMYGLPAATMYSLFGDRLPEDPRTRDLLVNGFEGAMFNKFLSLTSGEETYIDWSGLAPFDIHGQLDFIHSMFTTDIGTIVSESPAGSLFFGHNPRLSNFAKTVARYTNLVDDFETETEFSDVAMEFAKISSGFSNAYKAAYAEKYGRKMSSSGGITDPNISSMEALMQVFGFNTMDEARSYWIRDEIYTKSKAHEDDVKQWYSEMKKQLLRKDITPREHDYMLKVMSEAWRVWGNDDSRAKSIIDGLISRDAKDGDIRLQLQLLKLHDIMTLDENKTLIENVPDLPREDKDFFKEQLDYIQQLKDEN